MTNESILASADLDKMAKTAKLLLPAYIKLREWGYQKRDLTG